MSPPVLAIVGRSNSGKTTLMEKLVQQLTHQGLRIATIKHSHHQPPMDQPGKDSWRHKKAGAVRALLVGPEQMLMVTDCQQVQSPHTLATQYCGDVDLVLVEGYAALPGAKIEVVRAARSTEPRCQTSEWIALVTDVEGVASTVPQFALDDVDGIAQLICDWMQQ
ncbi:MAG: molybdopterin-guanine dinucleotide biosynthesis protein B [Mariprofundales bacterium]